MRKGISISPNDSLKKAIYLLLKKCKMIFKKMFIADINSVLRILYEPHLFFAHKLFADLEIKR
jgi:hypothetical protein